MKLSKEERDFIINEVLKGCVYLGVTIVVCAVMILILSK